MTHNLHRQRGYLPAHCLVLYVLPFLLATLLALIARPATGQDIDSTRAALLEEQLAQTTGHARLPILAELLAYYTFENEDRAIALSREAIPLSNVNAPAGLKRSVFYWTARAHSVTAPYDSAEIYIEDLQRWARDTDDREGLARASYLQGRLLWKMDDFEGAKRPLRQAITHLESVDNPGLLSEVYNTLGNVEKDLGDHDDALRSFEQALELRRPLADTLGIAEALHNIGIIHSRQGALDLALDFYEESLALREMIGDKHRIAIALNSIGIIHGRRGEYDQALPYFTRALAFQEDSGDNSLIAHAVNNIGLLHRLQGNYAEALDYFMRSLELRKAIGAEENIASSYVNIGIVHENMGDYEPAITFYENALAIYEKLGDKYGIPISLTNIGNLYVQLGKNEEAIDAYNRALVIREETGDREGISYLYNGLGDAYANENDYETARTYYVRSLDIKTALGDKEGIVNALASLGKMAFDMGRLNEALQYSNDALLVADSINAMLQVRDLHDLRYQVLASQERFAEALAAHVAFKAANDSLFSSESQSVIAELQQQYKTAEQQQQIEILERDREIQRLWMVGLWSGLALLGAIAFLVYNRYRLKNRAHSQLTEAHDTLQETIDRLKTTQQQLIHAEKMASLGQMTAGIAHEIRNPLNFVNNFALLAREYTDELSQELAAFPAAYSKLEPVLEELSHSAGLINKHGTRASSIVQTMMQHVSGSKRERRPVDLNALVQEQVNLAYHAKKSQVSDLDVTLTQHYAEDVGEIDVVPQDIARVLINVIDNALYAVHTKRKAGNLPVDGYTPEIEISTAATKTGVEIQIRDNGIGIPEAKRQRIFEPFFTTKPTGVGTGLGLSIAYDIITQGHNGTFTVESEPDAGAVFVIQLPRRV